MSKKQRSHPWLYRLLVVLLRLIALLPIKLQLQIAALLGNVGYLLPLERKRIIATNISLCFPALSKKEKNQLVRKNLISTTQSGFETLIALWANDDRIKERVTVNGLDHLKQAKEAGHGVILMAAHFTMLDLVARLIDLKLDEPMDMVYRAHNDPFIEGIIEKGRLRHCHQLIGKKEVVKLFEALRANHVVWYAPDQNFKLHNVFVPFFNIPASTVTFTSTIAKQTGAKIVPIFFHRKNDEAAYVIDLFPALDNFPSGDDYADTARLMKLIETYVRKHPDQYLWSHRRFKTRPEGEPLIYPKKKKKKH